MLAKEISHKLSITSSMKETATEAPDKDSAPSVFVSTL